MQKSVSRCSMYMREKMKQDNIASSRFVVSNCSAITMSMEQHTPTHMHVVKTILKGCRSNAQVIVYHSVFLK